MKKVTNSKVVRVFVYGTLKRGFCNHVILQDSLFLGNATVKGQLLDLRPRGNFPALIGKKNDGIKPCFVQGEVYLVDNETLGQLDQLEVEGELYHRKRTIAQMTTNCNGKPYQGQKAKVCHTYFWGINQSQNFPIIPTGNWA